MSRTTRKNGYTSLYGNLDMYLNRRTYHQYGECGVYYRQQDIDYYIKSFRDGNHETWKSNYRECTHRTMRRADKRLIHNIKNDPDSYDNMNMSHKYMVDIWGWV